MKRRKKLVGTAMSMKYDKNEMKIDTWSSEINFRAIKSFAVVCFDMSSDLPEKEFSPHL